MSDPRYTDPRLADPPRDELNERRLGELEQSNAMWGWIAGGIVLALLLVFIFGRSPSTTDTASTEMSPTNPTPATTTTTPPRPIPPAAQAPSPTPPSTTGQGSTPPASTGQGTQQ